jgi:hypothetical protein
MARSEPADGPVRTSGWPGQNRRMTRLNVTRTELASNLLPHHGTHGHRGTHRHLRDIRLYEIGVRTITLRHRRGFRRLASRLDGPRAGTNTDIPVSWLKLIMKSVLGRHGIGLFPGRQNALEPGFPGVSERTGTGLSLRQNALDPGFHSVGTGVSRGVRTHWIRGFIALEPGSRVRQNALEPGFHCVRTHWIRGFIAFRRIGRTRIMRLMVPVGPESGLRDPAARPDGGAGVNHRARRIRFYPSG